MVALSHGVTLQVLQVLNLVEIRGLAHAHVALKFVLEFLELEALVLVLH